MINFPSFSNFFFFLASFCFSNSWKVSKCSSSGFTPFSQICHALGRQVTGGNVWRKELYTTHDIEFQNGIVWKIEFSKNSIQHWMKMECRNLLYCVFTLKEIKPVKSLVNYESCYVCLDDFKIYCTIISSNPFHEQPYNPSAHPIIDSCLIHERCFYRITEMRSKSDINGVYWNNMQYFVETSLKYVFPQINRKFLQDFLSRVDHSQLNTDAKVSAAKSIIWGMNSKINYISIEKNANLQKSGVGFFIDLHIFKILFKDWSIDLNLIRLIGRSMKIWYDYESYNYLKIYEFLFKQLKSENPQFRNAANVLRKEIFRIPSRKMEMTKDSFDFYKNYANFLDFFKIPPDSAERFAFKIVLDKIRNNNVQDYSFHSDDKVYCQLFKRVSELKPESRLKRFFTKASAFFKRLFGRKPE